MWGVALAVLMALPERAAGSDAPTITAETVNPPLTLSEYAPAFPVDSTRDFATLYKAFYC